MRSGWILGALVVALAVLASPAAAQYIPDKLWVEPYLTEQNPGSTLHMSGSLVDPVGPTDFYAVSPIPDPFVMDESNIFGPSTGFSRNSHLAWFTRTGETGSNAFGHQFQRSEAWDIGFDMKIETPNPTPRKEGGFFFTSPVGDSMFIATSNAGHFEDGPGEITTVFQRVLPTYSFSAGDPLLGDYNHNEVIDGADYTIWRDTLGSEEDFRANGNNEGASQDLIDEADYETWKTNFGDTSEGGVDYNVGDTINMRMIYTPPVIDPAIPFNISDPGANVMEDGTMEYQIRINGGPVITSGPLIWNYADDAAASIKWRGIPNGTRIGIRAQNLALAESSPDASTLTFSNFDFDGPGQVGGGALVAGGGVPEPASAAMAVFGLWLASFLRRRR